VSDKTEQPTPKRLRKAQEEGDSPLSSFASQSAAFVAAVAVAPSAIVALSTQAGADLRSAIGVAAQASPTVAFDGAALASSVTVLVAPILAAAAVTAALASVVQTGGAIASKRLVPRFDKLDPIAGFKQLFSSTRLVAVLRAEERGAAVAFIVYGALRDHAADLARSAGRIESAAKLAGILALDVAKRVAIVGLFLAVLDIVVTRRAWTKKLMMTKEEVKREHKESEGDPQLKAARERAHHEMLASATIANVKNATVVVVNPTHLACALRYEEKKEDGEDGDEAPVVVATGQGDLARQIVEAAHQYGVPVVRDVPLARALIELEVGDQIPEVLYEAVAEILRDAWEQASAESAAPR
jgi:flagellar biosynthesis protein FlhB